MTRLILFTAACVASLYAEPCASNPTISPLIQSTAWNGWGVDASNARYQPAGAARLTAVQIPNLKLKWAFGFPGVRAVIGQPSVIAGRVFLGVDNGTVYSLDAATGCEYWTVKADAGVRTAITVTRIGEQTAAFFGDLRANLYAVNAATGAQLWKAKVEDHATARITGAPQLFEGRLYVPVASGEEGAAGNPNYQCCTFRGSVVALDASTGRRIWKTYVIPEEPKPTRKTARGVQQWGPSGAGIWSPPTIDAKRRALYVGTGDAYTQPAAPATDAIVALDLDSGKILWVEQDTKDDAWIAGCNGASKGENCPDDLGPDHDFGSPPILKALPNGKTILIAGQKSGNVWAHDPDDKGKVLWRTPLVSNTTEFGGKIIWGGAADEQTAYFGLGPGGIGAVQIRDGERKWFTALQPAPAQATHPGHDGPLTAIPDAIFSGGWDGVLRALSATDGRVIWEYNTVQDYKTVNGVAAKGGSMGAAGPVIAGGTLFVPSGYIGVKNGIPGNVLLVFSAD